MAVGFLAYDVSDICLGKPAIRSLPVSATVGEALAVLKTAGETYVSIWSCDHDKESEELAECRCIGKICMVDIIIYLGEEDNWTDLTAALRSTVCRLLPRVAGLVRHVEPHCSLVEALDLILDGAQNLVVPIQTRRKKPPRKQHSHLYGREFCWLTQEDIVRFLLNRIGLFSPMPARSIESLGIIRKNILAVMCHEPAASALGSIAVAHAEQTSVAVITANRILVGEISPSTLAACDEAVAAALVALSAGDLMAYIDSGGPLEHIVQGLKDNLKKRNVEGLLELVGDYSSSSDEEFSPMGLSPTGANSPIRISSFSTRSVRRADAIFCQKSSSLIAVMIQALAHRVNYVWVVEDDYSLAGIVTFSDVLRILREHLTLEQ